MRRRTTNKDLQKAAATWPVRKSCCSTCPFLEDKEGERRTPGFAATIEERCLSGSLICHHPVLFGKREHELCRGARNYQLVLMHRLGVLEEPTDDAWALARARLGC